MINLDGATLIFPTSFGYFDPHMLTMAPKYPDVQFRHCGGLWTEGKHPKNAGSYFGYIGMGQYLNGVVAGHTTQDQEARLRRRQADPAGAAQHQRLHAGRALGRPDDHHAGDLHRRLVAAGQGGRGHQQPGRPGRRRHHLPRRQPEGGGRDRRAARHLSPAATTPTRPSWRPRATSPAPSGTGPRSTRRSSTTAQAGKPLPQLRPRRPDGGLRQDVALRAGGHATRRKTSADAVKAEMHEGRLRHLQGPAQGQQGQRRDRRPARRFGETDDRAREDELPGRRRHRRRSS